MKKNEILEIKTEEINALGFGVAKVDGMVLFIGQSAPGDVAKVRVIKVAKTYAIGKIEELITPSPMRIRPSCPVSASCGGCAYSHISYDEEAKAKTESVRAALRKEGLSHISVTPLTSPSGTKAYRNKAQMPFAPDGSLGYFAPRSHRVVVPKDGCELLPDAFVGICDIVSSFVKKKGISVYDEESGKGLMRHLYLRMGVNTGEVMVCLVINGKEMPGISELVGRLYTKYPEIRTVVLNENREKTNVILGGKCHTVFGDGIITDTLCGNVYEISPLSFYQINHATAEAIYEKAIDLAELSENDVVADLYCGIGTIGLSIAKKADISRLVGVEIIPDAVKNAKKNAEINSIKNASFYCGDANDPHIEGCNVIFVDPPRKGLSKGLIERIGELQPDKVIYISCGVDTFARDLRLFKESGYETDTVYPYDMFPRTAHVECLGVLRRKGTVHNMKLFPAPFGMIKSGQKTIELRLYDEKRRKIKAGDTIVFTNTDNGETVTKTVAKLHLFDNFGELYGALPLLKCGYTAENVDKAHPDDMYQYYSAEEQKEYGVVGIELC